MDSLHRLEELFVKFPGIGPRQAKRFVYYLLGKSPSYIKEFTQLLEEVKKMSSECEQCHRIFTGGHSGSHKSATSKICSVCADASRDSSTLMIVARDSDFETVERSAAYKGLYFILGGTVPILDKEPDKRIRLKQLLEEVSGKSGKLKEIILSLNATPDGEHTATIIKEALGKVLPNSPLQSTKVTILGRGLSTGAELEYVDSDTIKNALQNRRG